MTTNINKNSSVASIEGNNRRGAIFVITAPICKFLELQ